MTATTPPETCPHGHQVAFDDGAFAVVELRDLADGGDRTACCGVPFYGGLTATRLGD